MQTENVHKHCWIDNILGHFPVNVCERNSHICVFISTCIFTHTSIYTCIDFICSHCTCGVMLAFSESISVLSSVRIRTEQRPTSQTAFKFVDSLESQECEQ